jgi:hypothetical protein
MGALGRQKDLIIAFLFYSMPFALCSLPSIEHIFTPLLYGNIRSFDSEELVIKFIQISDQLSPHCGCIEEDECGLIDSP